MKALPINFVSRQSPAKFVWLALIGCALAVAAALGFDILVKVQQLRALQAQVESVEGKAAHADSERRARPAPPVDPPPYAQDAAALALAASFPFDEVLSSVERLAGTGITIHRLQMSAMEGTASLDLTTPDSLQATGIIDRLNRDGPDAWHLQDMQRGTGGSRLVLKYSRR